MKKLLFCPFVFLFALGIQAQSTRLQLIHNSADSELDSLDVYLNETLFIDNLGFRNATTFLDVPEPTGTTPHKLYVCRKNSVDTTNYLYRADSIPAGENVVGVISGVVNVGNYFPARLFTIYFNPQARLSAEQANQRDLCFFHGSDDSPTIDVAEVTNIFPIIWADDLSYGSFSTYTSRDSGIYRIGLLDEETVILALSYAGFFHTPETEGKAYTLILSGFQIPESNSNGPLVSLFMTDSAGGELQELLPASILDSLSIQITNAIADLNTGIDVYRNGQLWIENLPRLNSTPFLKIPANQPYTFSIRENGGTDNLFQTFFQGTTTNYIGVFSGLASPDGNTPPIPLRFDTFENAEQQAVDPVETDVIIYHASTDLGLADVRGLSPAITTLSNDQSFGTFRSGGYLRLLPFDYTWSITGSDGSPTHGSLEWLAQSNGLTGKAGLLIIGGFLNPALNENGSSLGLWYVSAEGGALESCSVVTSTRSPSGQTFKLYPNPAMGHVFVEFEFSDSRVDVEISAIDGRLISRSTLNQSSQVDVSNLTDGIYLVKLIHKGNTHIQKLSIRH